MIVIDVDMPRGCNSCPMYDCCKESVPLRIEPRPTNCPLHEYKNKKGDGCHTPLEGDKRQ